MLSVVPFIKEAAGQLTWIHLDLPDLRLLARDMRSAAIDEIKRADDVEGGTSDPAGAFRVRGPCY